MPSFRAQHGIFIPHPEVIVYAVEEESVYSLDDSIIHAEKQNLRKASAQAVSDWNSTFPNLRCRRWPIGGELEGHQEEFLEGQKPNLRNAEESESSEQGAMRQAGAKSGEVETHSGELVVQGGVEEAFHGQDVTKQLLDSPCHSVARLRYLVSV